MKGEINMSWITKKEKVNPYRTNYSSEEETPSIQYSEEVNESDKSERMGRLYETAVHIEARKHNDPDFKYLQKLYAYKTSVKAKNYKPKLISDGFDVVILFEVLFIIVLFLYAIFKLFMFI